MPFGMVSVVGRGMGVLDGVVIVEGEGAVFRLNLGCHIVTMGPLLRSCAEVRAAIELSFVMVSGVTAGIHVLDGGPRASMGRGGFWDRLPPLAQCRVSMAYFVTEMYSTRV